MEFVDNSLARRIETMSAMRGVKYAFAQAILFPEIRPTYKALAGGFAVYAGQTSPMSRAMGVGLSGLVADEDLETIEQFYDHYNMLPSVYLCPLGDPSLLKLLKQKCYCLEHFFSVLFLPLRDISASFRTTNEDMQVTKVNPEGAQLWIRTVAQGFTGMDEPPSESLDLLAPTFHSADANCFLAWIDEQPAGGGAFITHEGIAEFCSVSTRPAFRNRGVQTTLLSARLRAAKEAGCDLATAVTYPGIESQKNAQRFGFCLGYNRAVMVKSL